jgi:hypothetical protein
MLLCRSHRHGDRIRVPQLYRVFQHPRKISSTDNRSLDRRKSFGLVRYLAHGNFRGGGDSTVTRNLLQKLDERLSDFTAVAAYITMNGDSREVTMTIETITSVKVLLNLIGAL